MRRAYLLCLFSLLACDVSDPTFPLLDGGAGSDSGSFDSGSATNDAEPGPDRSVDAGADRDASAADALPTDAARRDAQAGDVGPSDSTVDQDSGSNPDAGNDRDATTNADAGSHPDATPPDSGVRNSGQCEIDSDCPGGDCVELTPGGYRACKYPVVEAIECGQDMLLDECCNTSECMEGLCLETPIIPICAGIVAQPHNVCADALCAGSADCGTNSICLPAGVFDRKVASCFGAFCRLDSDCNDEAGGACVPLHDPCCGAIYTLACRYPGGCDENSDCPNGYCDLESGRGVCRVGAPICPA